MWLPSLLLSCGESRHEHGEQLRYEVLKGLHDFLTRILGFGEPVFWFMLVIQQIGTLQINSFPLVPLGIENHKVSGY